MYLRLYIVQNKISHKSISTFLYFLKHLNLSFLYLNKFDHRKSECDIDLKKGLFSFFINDILKDVEELNQKIIFVTFKKINT